MTAPIVTQTARIPLNPDSTDSERAIATIHRQTIEALPAIDGQLWTRLAEVNR